MSRIEPILRSAERLLRRSSVRSRIAAAMILLSMVPVLAIGTLSFYRFRQEALELATGYCRQKVTEIRRSFDARVDRLNSLSVTILYGATVQELLANDIVAEGQLAQSRYQEDFNGLRFVAETGFEVYKSFRFLGADGVSFESGDRAYSLAGATEWLDALLVGTSGRMVISPSVFESDRDVFVTSRLVRTLRDHSILAAVHVVIRSAYLEGIYGESLYGGAAHVIDHDGRILFSTDLSQIAGIGAAELADHPVTLRGVDRSDYFYVRSPSDQVPWTVVFSVPYRTLFADLDRVVGFIAVLCAIVLLISGASAYLVSRSIVDPLHRLGEAAATLEGDRYDIALSTDGNDELSAVSRGFNRMTSRIRHLITEVYEISLHEREAEIQALQAQISPHFLFNTLDAIRWEAKKEGAPGASRRIALLADLFRAGLANGDSVVTLGHEIRYTKLYLQFQEYRYSDIFRTEWDIDPDLLELTVVKLVLQPIVENSITHGLEQDAHKMVLRIAVCDAGDTVKIIVSDDGKGCDEDRIRDAIANGNRDAAYGLVNVNKRIVYYCGDRYGIDFRSQQGTGTTVTLALPKTRGGQAS